MQKAQNADSIKKVRPGSVGSSLKRSKNSNTKSKAFNPADPKNKTYIDPSTLIVHEEPKYMSIYQSSPKSYSHISGTGKDTKSQDLRPAYASTTDTKQLFKKNSVYPLGKPANISQTKNPEQTKKSVYEYLTSKATQAGTYSTRLARINPEKLSKLSGDEALNYLKQNFTSVKALEIKNFFNNELKDMNNAGEKAKKIKAILQNFTKDASKNNTIKKNMMSNISTFKNRQESLNNTKRRKARSNRTKEIEEELRAKSNIQLQGFYGVPEGLMEQPNNSYQNMSNAPPAILRHLKPPLNTVANLNVKHSRKNSYVDMSGMSKIEYNKSNQKLSQSTPVSTIPEVSGSNSVSNSSRRQSVSSQDGNEIELTLNPLYKSSNSIGNEGKYGYSPVIPFRQTVPIPSPRLLTKRNASGYVKPQQDYAVPVSLNPQIYTQPEIKNSIPNLKISRNKTPLAPLAPPTSEELLRKSNKSKVRNNNIRQLENNAKRIAARSTKNNPDQYNAVLTKVMNGLKDARGFTAPSPTYNTVDPLPNYNTVDPSPNYAKLNRGINTFTNSNPPKPNMSVVYNELKSKKNINPFTNTTKDTNPVYSTLVKSNSNSKTPIESIYSTLGNAGVRKAKHEITQKQRKINSESHKALLEALENGRAKSEIKRAEQESKRAKLESERLNRLKKTAIASGYTTASATPSSSYEQPIPPS